MLRTIQLAVTYYAVCDAEALSDELWRGFTNEMTNTAPQTEKTAHGDEPQTVDSEGVTSEGAGT